MIESSGASIELRNIEKRFGDVVALRNMSLTAAQGEFLTLLGPSGCGKTTALRVIAGLERATSGTVLINGRDVSDQPPHRRPVNTVFQQHALFPHLTVERNVAYGLEMAGVPSDERAGRVAEALARVHLTGIGNRRPDQLSGGQQQRVALARALVNKPGALLLDEPLGALDLSLRKEMQSELMALNQETRVTFVYVTHDQDEALAMSDRLAVMRDGQILQVGAPRDVYDRPASRFVAEFVGGANILSGQVMAIDGDTVRVGVDGLGSILASRPKSAAVNDLVHVAIRPERIRIDQVAGAPGPDPMPGTVIRCLYHGDTVEVVVALRTNAPLRIRIAAPLAPEQGREVFVSVRPEDAIGLPAE